MSKDFSIVTRSVDETRKLAMDFALKVKEGDVIALYGDLGSGKTQFVKGVCRSLGTTEVVNSPTFIIVNEYSSTSVSRIFHFDFYRLKHYADVESIGFDDYMNNRGVVLIEWPELVEDSLPAGTIKIHIAHSVEDENSRFIRMEIP